MRSLPVRRKASMLDMDTFCVQPPVSGHSPAEAGFGQSLSDLQSQNMPFVGKIFSALGNIEPAVETYFNKRDIKKALDVGDKKWVSSHQPEIHSELVQQQPDWENIAATFAEHQKNTRSVFDTLEERGASVSDKLRVSNDILEQLQNRDRTIFIDLVNWADRQTKGK
jgi:hypothetical protein